MKLKYKIIIIISCVFIFLYFFIILWYNGLIWPNTPSKKKYPVRGVDVSSYQGEIDWETLENQDIDFAFIKATEGSGYEDEYFQQNFQNASETGIRIGAYHFFSFDSSGITQAENFIKTVPKTQNMLPPVIDLEFYAQHGSDPPEKEETRYNLQKMIDAVYDYYGLMPVIYVTDIRIRSIFTKAELPDERKWTFWQYCNRGRLDGYDGAEQYIDLNVFNGTKEEFENYKG